MRPVFIVSVPPNTPTNDRHGIHNRISVTRATLVPGNKQLTNASQRLLVETEILLDLNENTQNAQAIPNENIVNQSSHTMTQEMTFVSKLASKSIHQSTTFWSPRNSFATRYISLLEQKTTQQ